MINLDTVISLVRREDFFPLAFLEDVKNSTKYHDSGIPIGYGQYATKPSVVRDMVQLATTDLNKFDSVLEIGTGCGYQTAILSHLFEEVCSIEYFELMAERASMTLRDYENVTVVAGDGREGLPGRTFDAIIVGTCFREVPPNLREQCSGNLVIPIGDDREQFIYLNEKPIKSCGFVLAQ